MITRLIIISSLSLIASLAQAKTKTFLQNQNPVKIRGKSNNPFTVEFKSAINSDNNLQLIAEIHEQRAMGSSEILWKLPENWKLIDGELTGENDFSKRKSHRIQIIVDGTTVMENDQAFLFIYKMKDGERYGVSTSYVHKPSEDAAKISSSQVKAKSVRKKPKKFFE